MFLEIEVPLDCVPSIFETNEITEGMCKDVPGIGLLRLLPMLQEERAEGLAYDSMPFPTLIVSLGASVAVNVFSSWLYDKLKGSAARRIRINRRRAEITPDGILKAVEETIELEER